MTETGKAIRLSKAAREFNVGISTIVEFLSKKGIGISSNPNTKLSPDMYELLEQEFQLQKTVKEEALKIGLDYSDHHTISIEDKVDSDKEKEKEFEIDEIFIKDSSLSKTEVEPDVKKPEKIKEVIEEKAEEIKEPIDVQVTDTEEISPKEEQQKEISEEVAVEDTKSVKEEKDDTKPRVVGKIDIEKIKMRTKPAGKTVKEKKKVREVKAKEEVKEKKKEVAAEKPVKEISEEEVKRENFIKTKVEKLEGPKIVDKIELPEKKKKPEKKPVASSKDKEIKTRKKRRKRIRKKPDLVQTKDKDTKERFKQKFKDKRGRKERVRPVISEDEVQKQIKETLAKLTGSGKSKAAKYRREKRQIISKQKKEDIEKLEEEKNVIKVTEFVTANELATMMDVQINDIISTCMSLGIFVSINQRLDAETLSLVAEEFGYEVEFVSVDVQEAIFDAEEEEEDSPEELIERAPIVTVMGHVDHGKTKLLDYIRDTNVIAGEAGGITQHIGAYEVTLKDGNKITFLDTPGHEAFTAMRARGAKVTDVAIIVIAADDDVMPQTKEAINHAQAAGVPIVFAINKIDKPNANVEKIKEGLSKMNILVEDWGGKYQSQEISAKQGINIDELLEKVLLEAEMLDLKANPDKLAHGTVIESSLDKGRGYVAKVLVQNGTLKTGDILIAGSTFGKVKAMYNERNQNNDEAGPSAPVLLLGLSGAPQAGDGFNVMKDERETKAIANKRLQLQREQGIRTQKHITLDEIGRRIAIGDFKELNIIVKGDVDGSVEALSDSLLKLTNEAVQVNIIHKSVGQVTESDVLLASASDAIIIGFQIRPSVGARKLAEKEQVDIRLYSIIYKAIEEIKAAIEGMLSPDIVEKIVCNVEIREIYKITKVGTVAGCMVLDGTITRNTRVRIIRDGIVVYTGALGSLKRFKDDVKEVKTGYECGLNIENFNDIKIGDIIEGFEEVEVKRKL
ncbi:MAG: translation initiation factor IF-2 [Bacteroidales bacterium]|nr:translation initiation factor IF-2 [Bacteroidales bacterium]